MDENINREHSQISNIPQHHEISLKTVILKSKEFFLYMRTKWLIIFITGLLGAVIGFAFAYKEKWIYIATLSFALEEDKGTSLGGALGLASTFGIDLGNNAGGAFSGANLVELMRSRRIVEKALMNPVVVDNRKISLAELYLEFSGLRQNIDNNSHLKDIKFLPDDDRSHYSLSQDSILGEIYSSIIKNKLNVAQKSPKISIINIEVRSLNELFSKVFAEELAREVSEFYIETRSKKAKLNLTILEHQTDSIRAELSGAISGVASANDNTYNLNPSLNIKRVPSLRHQFDVQANTTILTQLIANLELARVTLRKETPLIQIIDKPILPLPREKASKRRSTLFGAVFAGMLVIIYFGIVKWWKETSTKW